MQFTNKGWAAVTNSYCGLYIATEGTTAEDTEPVVFDTREEAEAERAQYIDLCLEGYAAHDDPELIEAHRESLELEELVLYVGVDAAGDVFELDPESFEVLGVIHRPDR